MNSKFTFNTTSIVFFVLGLILLTLGYIIMATGDITISPILLIIAYVVLFPLAILVGLFQKPKKQDKEQTPE